MKFIDEVPVDELRGKRVLVRAGLDLPVNERGEVTDSFRVLKALPTLKFLSQAGAKVIIISHIGREPSSTNASVEHALASHIKVTYIPDLCGHLAQSAIATMQGGEIILLENLRQQYDLEKVNDEGFAHSLASLADIYVNDAFSNSHREHASMVALPRLLPHYAGLIVRDEVRELSAARAPISPSIAILGGAKFETKEPLIKLFLEVYDHVFVAGALADDVFKARGFSVGTSLVSEKLPCASVLQNPKLIVPIDVTVERPDKQSHVKKVDEVASDERIVDMGPDSLALIAPLIGQAKFILWNGPTGFYEHGYGMWTHRTAELVAQSSARSVIGGGDTIASITESGTTINGNTFLSTGGGAMLEYLLEGTLPGIAVLD